MSLLGKSVIFHVLTACKVRTNWVRFARPLLLNQKQGAPTWNNPPAGPACPCERFHEFHASLYVAALSGGRTMNFVSLTVGLRRHTATRFFLYLFRSITAKHKQERTGMCCKRPMELTMRSLCLCAPPAPSSMAIPVHPPPDLPSTEDRIIPRRDLVSQKGRHSGLSVL